MISGRNPSVYCTLALIVMQGHQNKAKTHHEPGYTLTQLRYIGFEVGLEYW